MQNQPFTTTVTHPGQTLWRIVSSPCVCTCGVVVVDGCSVIPYLSVNDRKLLPLPVVMNAAGLLCKYSTRLLQLQYPSDTQCRYLNELCASASLDFTFRTSTELVDLAVVCALTQPSPYVRPLPGKDPFLHACFIDENLLGSPSTSAAVVQQWHEAPLHGDVSHPSNATSQVSSHW